MQKFVEFLEKYVEWIAIGLGGLFFLFMVYVYTLGSPVSGQLDQHAVTISNVDETVRDYPNKSLTAAMSDQTVPNFAVENFSNAVNKSLSMDASSQLVMAPAVPYQPIELPLSSSSMSTSPVVESLPELPAAEPVALTTGHTTVLVKAANPGAAPAGGGVIMPRMAPGAAAPAGGDAGNGGVKRDIDWVTGIFVIPVAPLADQWTKCFGPAKPGDPWKLTTPINTEVLMATLYRQEKDANGNWTKPQPIARLFNNPLPDYPAADNRSAQDAYRKWAESYQPSIITPPFPDVATAPSGTTWEPPMQVIQEIINPTAKVSPAQPIITPTGPVAPPPRQILPPGGAGRSARPGGPISPGGQPARPTPAPSRAPVAPTPVAPLPPESTETHVVTATGVTLTVPPTLITGGFNPMALTGVVNGNGNGNANANANVNILVFLHDDTIRPGTTYRYSLDYKLANPLFNKLPERAKDPKWVDQLDLTSPMSDLNASPVITPEGRLFFYCGQSNQPLDRGAAFPFEIYTWADGFWQRQVFKVNPGDAIGGTTAEGVDFSTGYTYVDGREVNNHFIVTLLDPAGNVVTKDAELDYNSQGRKLHIQLVDQSKPPAVNPGR